jgi:hypothetical protein
MTILEVIICIALIGVLFATLLAFFWQTLRTREQAAARADRVQLARTVLDHLAAELRGCVGIDQVGFPVEQRLVGDRRSIHFLTTALSPPNLYRFYRESEDLPPAEHDLRDVAYSLWVDQEKQTEEGEPIVGGVIRTEKKTLNQFLVDEEDPLDVRNDLWSPELGYLEFRYFDGVEWDTKWDITEGNSLPQLIQITVGFEPITKREYEDTDLDDYPIDQYPLGDDQPHPDRYSVIVRLPAADKFFSSRVQRLGKQLSDQLGVEGTP